jgi:hypothetical protein
MTRILFNYLPMNSTKELFLKVNEKMAFATEKASKYGMTVQSTRGNGRITWPMDMEG